MKMHVYLAAPYGARDFAQTLADDLRSSGCQITSSWLNETHEITPGVERAAADLADDAVRAHVLNDFAEIRRADLFVILTAAFCGTEGGGGRHVETGYAIAHFIPVIVLGEPENIFHRMGPEVAVHRSWSDALNHIRAMVELTAHLDLRRCRQCGCTDDLGCSGGCSWAAADLCSACSLASIGAV